MESKHVRVLIGSPIRQDPEVLSWFLFSLSCLETQGIHVDYYFVDDNDNPISSALLDTFAVGRTVLLERGHREQTDYRKDNQTHYWHEQLIWRVAEYKNRMIQHAVANGYDYLFLVDSDLVLHPATLQQLVSVAKPIVSEIFWTRWTPEQPELPQVWLTDQYTLFPMRRGENLTQEEVTERTTAFLRQLRIPGMYEVGGLGACTLIRKDALLAGVSFAEIPNLSFWGEDRHFCIRAAALGFSLYVDTHYPAFHIYRNTDLDRVTEYLQRTLVDRPRLMPLLVSKFGIEGFGTSDYRTMTGLEGVLYFTPEIRQLREQELESTLSDARQKKRIARTLTAGCQVLVDDVDDHHLGLLVGLVNFGEEDGRYFQDRLIAQVVLRKTAAGWLICNVEFDELLTSTDDSSSHHDQLSRGPLVVPYARKARDNKLVLSMVVRNEADRYLRMVLEHAATYVDEIVILDDASEDRTIEVCREAVGSKPLRVYRNEVSLFHNEYLLRMKQWELTLASDPDWILVLDADEIFEDRIKTEIRSLINQTDYDVVCFRLFDMWDMNHYRDDKYWKAHTKYWPLLLRYRPDFTYKWRQTPQHCGRLPANVLQLPSIFSPIRLKHYGWANPVDRQAKYQRYMQLDPEGKYGIMEQYQSILDPYPNLVPWEE